MSASTIGNQLTTLPQIDLEMRELDCIIETLCDVASDIQHGLTSQVESRLAAILSDPLPEPPTTQSDKAQASTERPAETLAPFARSIRGRREHLHLQVERLRQSATHIRHTLSRVEISSPEQVAPF